MSEILDVSRELKAELDKLPLFIEYKRVKAIFETNSELNELRKEIVRAKNENRLEDHKKLLEQYNNNPLVQNYASLKEDVIEYLKEVSKVIQEKWYT